MAGSDQVRAAGLIVQEGFENHQVDVKQDYFLYKLDKS